MKIISLSGVTASGKTTVINELRNRLPNTVSLHFDDYDFAGAPEDFYQWALAGGDYSAWDLQPLEQDILQIIKSEKYAYLLLDYPFAYCNERITPYIDRAIYIDTPLDVALARRVLRDLTDASADEIRKSMDIYIRFARISYVHMLNQVRPTADYVVDGTKAVADIVDEILTVIQ